MRLPCDENLLTKVAYAEKLEESRTEVGQLFLTSDVGRRISRHLNVADAIAFSNISKGVRSIAYDTWFAKRTSEIIATYIRRGASYTDYRRFHGAKDFLLSTLQLTGLALTVAAGVKAGIHAKQIPSNAPKKIVSTNEGECEVIDHPQARISDIWAATSGVAGGLTICGTLIYRMIIQKTDVDILLRLTPVEKEILLGEMSSNLFQTIFSPEFSAWKMEKLKSNLLSEPPHWQARPELQNMICPISGTFMLFPVKDRCGHHFDYRSVRAYQLNPETTNPLECPISGRKPNRNLMVLKFDKKKI